MNPPESRDGAKPFDAAELDRLEALANADDAWEFDQAFGPPTVLRLIAELKAAREQQAWRPIESAPRDGTSVLVADGFGTLVAACQEPCSVKDWWEDVRDPDTEPQDRPDLEGYAAYVAENSLGWISYDPLSGDEILLNPTLWKPLPTPPAGDA